MGISEGIKIFPRFDASFRILSSHAPTAKYFEIPHDQRTVNHWGQRKLLLSEIEFLLMYSKKYPGRSLLMVYAGAAPGKHIPYLADLFPHLYFHLYDPAPFDIPESERIRINPPESGQINGFFTDDVTKFYLGQPTLFVSDIRTGDPKHMRKDEVEVAVARDMIWQQSWIRSMRPLGSMLKFRLPWTTGDSEYVKGDIFLPVWGPQTTTETRLIVDIENLDVPFRYNHRLYEEQMFYWNTRTRVDGYIHDVISPGLDHCYDCAAEAYILERYLNWRYPELTKEQVRQRIALMIVDITQKISKGHRDLSTQVKLKQRKQWFAPRRYDTTNFEVHTI